MHHVERYNILRCGGVVLLMVVMLWGGVEVEVLDLIKFPRQRLQRERFTLMRRQLHPEIAL
ncbi:hypothetical protein J6590_076821 [Homalodisca vitripennis]|nr:hypothetical protein J6590_076821 [Homalodisca vitripennis]